MRPDFPEPSDLVGDWYDIIGDGFTVGQFQVLKNQAGGLSVGDVICTSDVFDEQDSERIAELAIADGSL